MLEYRKCVGIVVFNSLKKIFSGKRIYTKNYCWQMPQGGIEENENIKKAALRELYEETGITCVKFLSITKDWHFYDIPKQFSKNSTIKGQKQKWTLFYYHGDHSDIKLDTFDKPEFKSWKWLTQQELIKRVVFFRRKVYNDVFREFTPIIDSHNK